MQWEKERQDVYLQTVRVDEMELQEREQVEERATAVTESELDSPEAESGQQESMEAAAAADDGAANDEEDLRTARLARRAMRTARRRERRRRQQIQDRNIDECTNGALYLVGTVALFFLVALLIIILDNHSPHKRIYYE